MPISLGLARRKAGLVVSAGGFFVLIYVAKRPDICHFFSV